CTLRHRPGQPPGKECTPPTTTRPSIYRPGTPCGALPRHEIRLECWVIGSLGHWDPNAQSPNDPTTQRPNDPTPMAALFNLPQMGQTMTEATVLKWLKQEGEHVESWEAVVEMMTDKINMEVEPLITGTLRKILAPEGALVPVGAPIAIIGAP